MIEDTMLFLLGFCVATLFALLCLPLVWSRARRLTRRRLEMLVPLSADEIAAERDGLRAKAAVEHLALEQQFEAAKAAVSQVEIELGRRTVELATSESARASLGKEHTATVADLAETRTALAAALDRANAAEATVRDLRAEMAPLEAAKRTLEQRLDETLALAQSRQLLLASLDVRLAELETAGEVHKREMEVARVEQARLRLQTEDLARERDNARVDLLRTVEQRTMLHIQLKDENRRFEDTSARLLAANEALTKAEHRMAEQERDLKASAQSVAELKARFDRIEARLREAAALPTSGRLPDSEVTELRAALASVSDDAIRLLGVPSHAGPPAPAAALKAEGGRQSSDLLL